MCKYIFENVFKKLEEYIQMNHRYFDKDEREILFYSKLSSFVCVCVLLTQEELEQDFILYCAGAQPRWIQGI